MTNPFLTDEEAKTEILSVGKKLYLRGLVAANDGNLSIRVGEAAVWVTPTGVSKSDMTEEMLVKLDLDGNRLAGNGVPSSEAKLHLRIYKENPTVRAVVHAHPPAATAFACAGLSFEAPILQEAILLLGKVPLAPFAPPGSEALAESIVPFCRNACSALLERHGAVTWGETMTQAHHRMECLEQLATVTLHLKTLGQG